MLTGPMLDLFHRVDAAFLQLAARWDAADHRFGPFLDAADLERIDYFSSFPHLVTFASAASPDRPVLTPAACYHVYAHLKGRSLDAGPVVVTTRNTCFRHEDHFVPMERQWAFDMREIVMVGSDDDVKAFLAEARAGADEVLVAAGLTIEWQQATDPFFQPAKNPAYVMQRLDPVKHEAVFDGRLAIASANLHHDHFGAAFEISLPDGRPASSACIAFGLERWLSAIVATHGEASVGVLR